jgi:hypothetical protein
MPLSFSVSATDVEGGALSYSAAPLPAGASFNTGTRTFQWTPTPGSEGTYSTTFNVVDGQAAADSEAVTITVVPTGATTPMPGTCTPDTASFAGTIGVNVDGNLDVSNFHSFFVPPGTQEIRGALSWTGGPAIDLDLYLVDPSGDLVASGATSTSDPEQLLYINPSPGTYQWQVVSFTNPNPNLAYTVTGVRCIGSATGVETGGGGVSFGLDQNMPNPFVRNSVLRFALPRNGIVKLKVYDVSGRLVRTLVDGPLGPGLHQRVWDGRTDRGGRADAGVYFARLEAEAGIRSRKLIMLR